MTRIKLMIQSASSLMRCRRCPLSLARRAACTARTSGRGTESSRARAAGPGRAARAVERSARRRLNANAYSQRVSRMMKVQ
jgi:hypothetical protein